ncbi:MAG: signal recognition particle subunit SRP19/SEC65 family protein [Vulcanisaeta sp.]|jgi:signal recognition particle subunit SRP19|nr:signal recognition particle subunit SRP19/SEC65 family protein [Vulcanisaeta sp.]MCG2870208.1 signal recognition particle subunit SRP19/SEC65 family protein [Vulcanisaeta sp.]MCG2887204.1 signal recognition particle subunit SRP19/SEC65 family protein [Vulcanisaeta sp.]MCG2895227.1 signal recognition particle subunit SRP19/SEC65 family protein [Vulcanisaeta sp.]
MDKEGYWIVWTVYFDSTKSRKNGRKVPRSIAVKAPTIDELVKAATNLGLEFEVYNDKKHPASWFEGPYGYIAVKKREGLRKRELIKAIARELVRIRQQASKTV